MRIVWSPSKLLPRRFDAEGLLEPHEIGGERVDQFRLDHLLEHGVAVARDRIGVAVGVRPEVGIEHRRVAHTGQGTVTSHGDLRAGRRDPRDPSRRVRASRRDDHRERPRRVRVDRVAPCRAARRLRLHRGRHTDVDPGRHGRPLHRGPRHARRQRLCDRPPRPPRGLHGRGRRPRRDGRGRPAPGGDRRGRAGRRGCGRSERHAGPAGRHGARGPGQAPARRGAAGDDRGHVRELRPQRPPLPRRARRSRVFSMPNPSRRRTSRRPCRRGRG